MEKYRTKIDLVVFLTLAMICVLDIAALVLWVILGVWWPALVISAIILVLIVPQYFFTYYELNEKYLKINFGIFLINYKIPYDQILAVAPEFSYAVGPKLSKQSIKVVFFKNNKAKTMYISPAMFDVFLDQLTDNVLQCAIVDDQIFEEEATTTNPSATIKGKSNQAKNTTTTTKKPSATKTEKTTKMKSVSSVAKKSKTKPKNKKEQKNNEK